MYNNYDFDSNRVYYEDPKKKRKRQLQLAENQSKADLQRSMQKKNNRFSQGLAARSVLGNAGRAFQGTKVGDGLYKYTGQQALDALNNNPKEVITGMIDKTKALVSGADAGTQLVQNATNAVEAANAAGEAAGSTAQGIGTATDVAVTGAEAGSEAATAAGEAAGEAASSAGSAVPVAGIIIKAITEYMKDYKRTEDEQNSKLMEASNDELTDAIKAANESKLKAVNGLNETQSVSDIIDQHIKDNAEKRYDQLDIEQPQVMSLEDVTDNLNKTKEKQLEEASKNEAKADGGLWSTLAKPLHLSQKLGAGLVKLTNNMTGIAPLARNIDTGITAIEALDDKLEGKSRAYVEKNPLELKEDANNALVNAGADSMPTGQTQSAKNAIENTENKTEGATNMANSTTTDAKEQEKESIVKDIMNQVASGYADNRENAIAFDNFKRDPNKTFANRAGEAFGTLARLASNPYVQGAIAGGVYGAGKGDALYGLGKGWEWAQNKSKADNYYKAITGRDDAPIFNSYDLGDYKAHVANENAQREYDRKVANDLIVQEMKKKEYEMNLRKAEETARHNKAMEGLYDKKVKLTSDEKATKADKEALYNADLAEFVDIFNGGDQGQIEYARQVFMKEHGKDPFKYIKLTSDWEEQVGY